MKQTAKSASPFSSYYEKGIAVEYLFFLKAVGFDARKKRRDVIGGGFGGVYEGEFYADVFIFGEAELTEFKKLYLLYIFVGACYLVELSYAFLVIVYTLYYNVAKPGVNISLGEFFKEEVYPFFIAKGIFLIVLGICHLIIE